MKLWRLGIIIIAAAVVFAPTLGTYFSQDDWVFLSHIYKQPFLAVWKHYPEAFYRPVGQQLFFWIGSGLFGLESGGFHFLGILIHLINIVLLWKLFRYFKISKYTQFLLLFFYAVNPAHFVALNWLTQSNIEIAVSFSLASTYLLSLRSERSDLSKKGQTFWAQIGALLLFLFGVLSHEVIVFLPIVWWLWFKQKRVAIIGLAAGLALIGTKFLANPFSSNADYTISTNILGIISTLKWYGLRALFIPEGIRNFPVWLTVMSLVPALFLFLIFRQRLIKVTGIYLLGILPVLGFGSHLLAAYAVFGIALMVIELGKTNVISRMTMILASVIVMLAATGFVYSNYLNHWSTGRGIISRQLTREYIRADLNERGEILTGSRDFVKNPEIYFSSMMGKQFEVLDRGVSRGFFGPLFYRGNDLATQFLPDAEFFRDSILAGKFPTWNPWIMAGMPYYLDPQNFLWYPPNYIFLLMPVETGFLILLVGHLALAGWGTKRVLGEFGIFGKLALLGAALYILSPKLVGHIEEGNWTLVIAACWLPILYWALKKSKFWWTVISLSAIIINNLNIGYYSILFTVIYYLIVLKRPGLAAVARPGLKMLLITILLTIPRWLPLALFGNQTVRANLQEAPLPFWSWTKIFKSLFFPLAEGHPLLQNEEILYFGILPLTLGIIIVYIIIYQKGVSFLKQGGSLFWFVWWGFISLVAINLKTPFFYLIKLLPGFSLLRITTRPWIFVSLALAIFVPLVIRRLAKRSKLLAGVLVIAILLEYAYFGYGIFSRRQVVKDPIPYRFYQAMAPEGSLTRAYCTTGCLDRLTAQKMGIALLGGNNPIQLTEFVNYLQRAGGYTETDYFPILPPYTVFNQRPQPDAGLMAQTDTKFVVSSYDLVDENFELIDQQGDFKLYRNKLEATERNDHYFEL